MQFKIEQSSETKRVCRETWQNDSKISWWSRINGISRIYYNANIWIGSELAYRQRIDHSNRKETLQRDLSVFLVLMNLCTAAMET